MCQLYSFRKCAASPRAFSVRPEAGEVMTCKKCKVQRPVVNLRVRDAYCRDCFLTAVHHKFRATLGKHKVGETTKISCTSRNY